MQLEALFKQPQALPAVPKIVHELIDSFNSEDISIDEIAKRSPPIRCVVCSLAATGQLGVLPRLAHGGHRQRCHDHARAS